MYSFKEVVQIYDKVDGSHYEARNTEKFPSRKISNEEAFQSYPMFKNTQNFHKSNVEKSRTSRTFATEETVLRNTEENPNSSTREIARKEGIHHVSVLKILKENSLHSCYYQKMQELIPN